MVDENRKTSPENKLAQVDISEDADTRAARRELKQSSISDPPTTVGKPVIDSPIQDKTVCCATSGDLVLDILQQNLKDQISSPKKKRAHDQLDGSQPAEENDATSVASTESAKDRTSRLEPEKKRHRDEEFKGQGDTSSTTDSHQVIDSTLAENTAQRLAGAFSSGFENVGTGSSPFANLSSSKGSVFGSSCNSSRSPFPSLEPAAAVISAAVTGPKLTFVGSGSTSPFASLASASNGAGTGISGSGFGSTLPVGKPLLNFAAPGGKPLHREKPVKPFGAPESDSENDDDDFDGGEENPVHNEAERAVSPEKDPEERKRTKLHKVEVDDGEAGETAIVSVRAKMFYHDKEAGWKERGGGMLKINVPQTCVDFDESGAAIPGSFDVSGLESEDANFNPQSHKVCRLLMRQDQTHRVILNTALVPAMKFQEKASLKSVNILFTAFEGNEAKPVNVTMRLTAANAKCFLNEIKAIQRELQSN